MRIAVTGSSGLIGTALSEALRQRGDQLQRIVRSVSRTTSDEDVVWDIEHGVLNGQRLEGADAVVHLAGENIASGRWTARRKQRILESRTGSTSLLARTLAGLHHKPRVLACASAIGIYGDRGDELLSEESEPGTTFLARVCQQWEAAAQVAADAGIRLVHLRFGMVLSTEGGALPKMLTPFRLGLGGPIGNGRQFMSWVAIDDVVGAIEHVLDHDAVRGPVNIVAPQPVTNREFATVLGKVLRRPAVLPLPAPVVRLLMGEMADELLLASARVVPGRLEQSGYTFRYDRLEAALRALLGR